MKDNSEAILLRQWASCNPRAPAAWLVIAERLSENHDMAAAWATLRRRGATAMAVFRISCDAWRNACREDNRLAPGKESASIERVKQVAQELKTAIEQSPLPRDWAALREVSCTACEPAHLMIGWRDLQPDGYGLALPLAITEVLDLAIEMAEEFSVRLPPRAIARRRNNPLASSFVRWLTRLFILHYNAEMHATVGYIATAVMNCDPPITKETVEGYLKDAPAEFRLPKAPSRTR